MWKSLFQFLFLGFAAALLAPAASAQEQGAYYEFWPYSSFPSDYPRVATGATVSDVCAQRETELRNWHLSTYGTTHPITFVGLLPSGHCGVQWLNMVNGPPGIPVTSPAFAPIYATCLQMQGWVPGIPRAGRCMPQRDDTCPAGNPVSPGTGVKLHHEDDYAGAGVASLGLVRHYQSAWRTSPGPGLGGSWSHNHMASVTVEAVPGAPIALALRPDGSTRRFAAANASAVPRVWTVDSGAPDALLEVRDSGAVLTGWELRSSLDDNVERYNAAGKLLSITHRNGWVTTLAYSTSATAPAVAPKPGLLLSVTNPFGRQLGFTYDQNARMAELLPPGAVSGMGAGSAASPIRYRYEEPGSMAPGVAAMGQLTSVTWQDGAVRRYHYEDPRWPLALTGITDEAGVRLATYAYDTYGRVAEEQHAGGADRMAFSYAGGQTTVTDYSGAGGSATQRTYSFVNQGGVLRPSGVTAPCSLCGSTQQGSTYDGAGQLTRSIGHDGKITFYAYDAKGRQTERALYGSSYASATTRPALNLAESVTSTQWHATFRLPMQVAEPGKITAYTYSSKGNLTGQSWTATTDPTGATKFNAVKTGSTYATGWGYNSNSLNTSVVEKANAVETARWTLVYNGLGDVTRVTDVTGGNRVGTATQYDAQGRLLTGTTTLGLPVAYGYFPRGFVRTRTVNGQLSSFTQNAIGLTTDATLPDGQTVRFDYDATHRLTSVRLNGALLSGSALKEGALGNATLAIAGEKLQWLIASLMRPAHAQAAQLAGPMPPGSVVPGMGLPGQFGAGAAGILTANDYPGERPGGSGLPLFGPSNEAGRRLAERLTKMCQCDPDGGYTRPTLRPTGYAHIVISGHTGPAFGNKSYFTEPVNQALVDEVVSKDTRPDVPGNSRRVYFVPDMGRPVGFSRRPDGTFTPERGATLIVHKDNCNNLFLVRNEVITMYPGR